MDDYKQNLMRHGYKVVIGLFFLFGLLHIHYDHEWGDDFALYLSQTRAITDGSVNSLFTMNKWSMLQSERAIGPYLYPFGYPLVLTPVFWAFGGDIVALKVWVWLIVTIGFSLFWAILKKFQPNMKLSNNEVLLLFSWIVLYPKYIERANYILSDMYFAIICFSFFYFLFIFKESWLKWTILLLLFLLASFTRSNGLLLLPVYCIHQVLKAYSRNQAFNIILFSNLLVPFVLCSGAMVLYGLISSLLPKGQENHWAFIMQADVNNVKSNIVYYYNLIGTVPIYYVLKFLKGSLASDILIFISWLLILKGIQLNGRKGIVLFVWVALNILLYILWPFVQGIRFIFPVLPIFIYYFLAGLHDVFNKIFSHSLKGKMIIVMMSLLFFQLVYVTFYNRTNKAEMAFGKLSEDVYDYCRNNLNKDAVIAFDKPRLLYYKTGIKSLFIESDSFFTVSKATHRVLRISQYLAIQPRLNTDQIVYRNDSFVILQKR